MKLLFENWREYLLESVEDLKHISAAPWSSEEAKHEWGEEINTSIEEGDKYIAQRWPGLSKEVIEKDYPFLLSPEDFAEALSSAPIKNLSPSEMKEIHNHAQVYDIVEMYEKDTPPEEVYKAMFGFFKGTGVKTDPAMGTGKRYSKEQSYDRWVKHFKEQDKADKPPIVLQLPNGGLAHVGGQTRQTGALTNQKIIPYAILAPIKGESDETPT
jgi:hypothetical protein